MRAWWIGLVLIGVVGATGAQEAAPLSALDRMPVREITVFKDGHAFLVHEGKMKTDAAGNVQMDYLPTPVLGTFWPYSSDRAVKLSAVTASPRRVMVERTAQTMAELLEANPGVLVDIAKTDGAGYAGVRVIGRLIRSSKELQQTDPAGGPERLPVKTDVFLFGSGERTLALPFSLIKDLTFHGPIKTKLADEEFRNLLTMKLEWPGGRPQQTANVGMAYLQKGVRWIPSYRIAVDGKGAAEVKLQATLINELTDLSDVAANLVIGVPTFAFKDTPDPISLQQTIAQLSPYFQMDSKSTYAMSNGLMGQMARGGEAFRPNGAAQPDAGPEVGGGDRNEDLFVFNVRHVSLKKGQRMVLPVADYALKYKDIFTVDIPFAPPQGVQANINTEQQAEIARMLAAPKAIHKLRIANSSKQPLTTAPALMVRGDQLLGQGMMTFTAPGSSVDLTVTTAPDIRVKRSEKETARVPNAAEWRGNHLMRIDMAGSLTLTNYRDQPVDLEVSRYVLGQVDKVADGGTSEMLNALEDDGSAHADLPAWWGWYNWPGWWRQFNGLGRFAWKQTLAPGKSITLDYTWHYFAE